MLCEEYTVFIYLKKLSPYFNISVCSIAGTSNLILLRVKWFPLGEELSHFKIQIHFAGIC